MMPGIRALSGFSTGVIASHDVARTFLVCSAGTFAGVLVSAARDVPHKDRLLLISTLEVGLWWDKLKLIPQISAVGHVLACLAGL